MSSLYRVFYFLLKGNFTDIDWLSRHSLKHCNAINMLFKNKITIPFILSHIRYILVILVLGFELILATFYTKENSTDVFKLYKSKYNKLYKTKDEEENRYKMFIINLNTVDKLNENSTDVNTFYVLNQYADLDPVEIEEQFALDVKPCK